MWECRENVGGIFDPVSSIGIDQGHDVGGYHLNLFIHPSLDDVMFQSGQQVYKSQAWHVVCEDEDFLGEDPEVLGVISLPGASVSSYQFCKHNWYEAVCFTSALNGCDTDRVLDDSTYGNHKY